VIRRTALLALLAAGAFAADAPAPPAPVSAEAGGAKVTVSTRASGVRVGQPVVVDFMIDLPRGAAVETPRLPRSIDAWDVQGSQAMPADPANPERVVERVTFVTFEAGERPLPSLSFTVRAADGTTTTLASPALAVPVASLVGEDADPRAIREVKGAVTVPVAPRWPWVVGGAAIACLAAWLAWLCRASLLRLLFTPTPPETPHERANRRIESLQALALPATGRVQEFYVQLTGIVRELVEGHFGIRAPEQTTTEFLRSARHHPGLLEEHRRFLAGFLRSADLVKFAGERPATAECDRSLLAARQFVQETEPRSGSTVAGDATEGASTGVAA
jgi:hypothetical protein